MRFLMALFSRATFAVALVLTLLFILPSAKAGDPVNLYKTRFAGALSYTNLTGRDIVIPSILLSTLPADTTNTVAISVVVTQDDNMTTNVADTVSCTYAVTSLVYVGSSAYSTDIILPANAVLKMTNSVSASTNSVLIYREER